MGSQPIHFSKFSVVNGKIGPNKRMRFSAEDDFVLLQEFLNINPWEDPSRWPIVQRNTNHLTGKSFSVRSVREHLEHLLKLFMRDDKNNMRKNESEITYIRKQRLLQQISNLALKYKSKKFRIQQTTSFLSEDQKTIENDQKPVESSPQHLRLSDNVAIKSEESIDYSEAVLEEFEFPESVHASDELENDANYNANPSSQSWEEDKTSQADYSFVYQNVDEKTDYKRKELELEAKRLMLEEKKLDLERQKFEMEKEERQLRLQLEIKEREANIKLIAQQQQIITNFMKQFLNMRSDC